MDAQSGSDSRRARLVVWLLTALIVIAAVVTNALQLTSENAFCSWCHEMAPHIEALARSSHAHSTCYSCHLKAGAGPVGVVLAKLVDLKELKSHAFGYEKPIDAGSEYAFAVSRSADCEQCHSMETRVVIPPPGIIIDHKVHTARRIRCTWCHNRNGHVALAPYEDWQLMEGCDRCHGQEPKGAVPATGALAALRSAKPAPASPEDAEGLKRIEEIAAEQLRELADYRAPGTCALCHTKAFELKPSDHDQRRWLSFGHRVAYFEDLKEATAAVSVEVTLSTTAPRKPCYLCHRQAFCDDCHGLAIPHAAGFRKAHASYRGKTALCAKCHPDPSFCGRCHHSGVGNAAAWLAPSGHPVQVLKGGTEPCRACHQDLFCTSCHKTGRADPSTH